MFGCEEVLLSRLEMAGIMIDGVCVRDVRDSLGEPAHPPMSEDFLRRLLGRGLVPFPSPPRADRGATDELYSL